MRNKLTLLLAAILVISVTAKAEGGLKFNPEPSEKRPVGITVGFIQKSYKMGKNSRENAWAYIGDDSDKERQGTLQLGLTINPEFKYGIGLMTGLFYELTPSSDEEEQSNVYYKYSITDHELSIPLRISYRYEIIKGLSVFAYTGPSFDIGLAYTQKILSEYGGDSYWLKVNNYSRKVWDSNGNNEKYTNDEFYDDGNGIPLKRLHMMWGVGGGLQYKGLRLTFSGDWGMGNINAYTGKTSSRIKLSKPFAVSLSYMF